LRSLGIDAWTGREVLDGVRYMLAPKVDGNQMEIFQDDPEDAYPRIDRTEHIRPNDTYWSRRLVWENLSLGVHLRNLRNGIAIKMVDVMECNGVLTGEEAILAAQNCGDINTFREKFAGNPLLDFYCSRAISQAWYLLLETYGK